MARARSRRVQRFTEAFLFTDFTDGGSASGYVDMTQQLPADCAFVGFKVDVLEGFTGNFAATLTVGKAGFTSFFSEIALSTFLVGTVVDAKLVAVETATTVRITIAADSDFTAVDAGEIAVSIAYIEL